MTVVATAANVIGNSVKIPSPCSAATAGGAVKPATFGATAPSTWTFVITQNDEAGWRVSVDGADAKKSLYLKAFRAVDVAPGRHQIVWRYHPLSLVIGAIVTLITMLFIALALFLSR